MSVLGLGIDLVGVEGFAVQLADRASGFVAATFTAGERRAAERGDPPPRAERLAARCAAKEAFVKAWSAACAGRPPDLGRIDLREIEVVDDGWGRPRLRLSGAVAEALERLAGETRERLVSVVADDGSASDVDGGVAHPLAPGLVSAVGDAGSGDADRLSEAPGEVTDLGDGERRGSRCASTRRRSTPPTLPASPPARSPRARPPPRRLRASSCAAPTAASPCGVFRAGRANAAAGQGRDERLARALPDRVGEVDRDRARERLGTDRFARRPSWRAR